MYWRDKCDYCPLGYGYKQGDGLTGPECVRCEDTNCGYCAEDYRKCDDNIHRLRRVVENARGHMGLVTLTLEWRDDVDLDLRFFCKQNGEKVYYGNKYSKRCDAKLDVDMMQF